MNTVTLNSNTRYGFHALWRSQRAAPYPGLASSLQHSEAEWWMSQPVRSADGLQSVWASERFMETFLYFFTFREVSEAGILISIFTYLFPKPYLWMF
jgi:hypothetical protein